MAPPRGRVIVGNLTRARQTSERVTHAVGHHVSFGAGRSVFIDHASWARSAQGEYASTFSHHSVELSLKSGSISYADLELFGQSLDHRFEFPALLTC